MPTPRSCFRLFSRLFFRLPSRASRHQPALITTIIGSILVAISALALVACAHSAPAHTPTASSTASSTAAVRQMTAPAQTRAQMTAIGKLSPAPDQPDPTNLWDSQPIPAVVSAVNAVRDNALLPKTLIPTRYQLEHGYKNVFDMATNCQPAFGPGVSVEHLCRLADTSSKHIVTVIGDSHGGTWMPAVVAAGRAEGFTVVPLDKPGCLLTALHHQSAKWPCAAWYRWALGQDRRLDPVATIVSFQLTAADQTRPATTIDDLRTVLGQVPDGVLLVDSPGQSQQPIPCVTNPQATMHQCSSRVPSDYVRLMRAIARMSAATDYPAIPTLQWFCADGICPMVIDHALVLHDLSHMTAPYSTDLGPVFNRAFKPIYTKLLRQR